MPHARTRRPISLSAALALCACLLLGLVRTVPAVEHTLEEARALRGADPAAALALLSAGIETETPSHNPTGLAELLRLRAEIYRNQGRLEPAVADATRYLGLAEAMDDPVRTADALFMLGSIEAEGGDIPGALERFHEARQRLEGSGAHAEAARVSNAIGVAHNFLFDYERARGYYASALEMARAAGDSGLETTILGNLAVTVSETDGPEAGLAVHRQALALAEERGDDQVIAYQLGNICSRLIQSGDLDRAETTCDEAVERLERLGHFRILAGTRMSRGELRMAQGRLEEAEADLRAALALVEGNQPSVELTVLQTLAELHERRDRPAAALDSYRRAMALRENLIESERANLIEELEVRYQVEQREREIELLRLDAELQAARLQQRNLMLAGTAVALGLSLLLAVVAWRGYRVKSSLEAQLAARNRELEQAVRTIGHMARRDSLTGLLNRRAFDHLARGELQRSRRSGKPVTLVMADIDRFKEINDRHGHATGDEILKQVAERLQVNLRKQDVLCRWGGEEFVFLLPETEPRAACRMMERILAEVSAHPLKSSAGLFPITLTFGVARAEADLDEAIHAADLAMYQGKRAGRDRVQLAACAADRRAAS